MTPARTEPTDQEPDIRARPPLVREFLLVAGLFLAYKLGRQAANGHVEEAFRNAGHVWDLERALRLPGEGAVQGLLLHSQTLIQATNTYYTAVHFPATALFLVWLYWRRPRHYLWSRRVLAALTAAALVLHLLFPLAPPRMLPAAGLVDTGQVYGPTVYGQTPATDTMANQFAAMPSLHVGWAVMIAVGLIVATRSRWRWLWLLHPAITLLVVVGTANHYWLDAIVVAALLAVALAAVRLPMPARTVPAHRPPPGPRGSGAGSPAPAHAGGAVPPHARGGAPAHAAAAVPGSAGDGGAGVFAYAGPAQSSGGSATGATGDPSGPAASVPGAETASRVRARAGVPR
ncbi:phosphatase PAP2 family protein [Streptomyces sp. NPDC006267]|uniref:phosphatase PAP2 family protein n=1 Tax=Streptomyces sp. NPDC006267 TaxID=3157173 RepID=UPI0033BF0FBD